jgi:hypothetical protein
VKCPTIDGIPLSYKVVTVAKKEFEKVVEAERIFLQRRGSGRGGGKGSMVGVRGAELSDGKTRYWRIYENRMNEAYYSHVVVGGRS